MKEIKTQVDGLWVALSVFTIFLGVIPASFLAGLGVPIFLVGGLLSLNPMGILWGGAILAGTISLWRVAFIRFPGKYTLWALVAGMLAISPIILQLEMFFSIWAGPFHIAAVHLLRAFFIRNSQPKSLIQ